MKISGRITYMKVKEDRALQRMQRFIDRADHNGLLAIRRTQDRALDGMLRSAGDAIFELEGDLASDTLDMISDVMAGISAQMPSGAGEVIEASYTAWKLVAVMDDERFLEGLVARGSPGTVRAVGDMILALKAWLLVSEAVLDRLTWQSWVTAYLNHSDRTVSDRYAAKRRDDPPAT